MKYLLAAAAIAVLATTPASAKKMMMSCGGGGDGKMYAASQAMPYGPERMMTYPKVAAMNMAMSKGDMRGCNRAMMGRGMMKSKMM